MNDLANSPANDIARIAAALKHAAPLSSSDFDLDPDPDIRLLEGRELRAAGTLAPLVRRADGGLDVVLTKRASGLKHHPGQIAFPGGKVDPGDAGPEDTALREAYEEIGLPRDRVTILGALPPHETVTGFLVTPFVGLVKGAFTPVAQTGEVAEIFPVPLSCVLASESFSIQSRYWRGQRRHYFVVPFGPYYIWGATARILRTWAAMMI